MVKKACPDGRNCKFLDEHQHTSEYSHDAPESAADLSREVVNPFSGKGRKLATTQKEQFGGGLLGNRAGGKSRLLDQFSGVGGILGAAPPAPPPPRAPAGGGGSTGMKRKLPEGGKVIELLDSDTEDGAPVPLPNYKPISKPPPAVSRPKISSSLSSASASVNNVKKGPVVDLLSSDEEGDDDNDSDAKLARQLQAEEERQATAIASSSRGGAKSSSGRRAPDLGIVSNGGGGGGISYRAPSSSGPGDYDLSRALANSNRDVKDDQELQYQQSLAADRAKGAEKEKARREAEEKEQLQLALAQSEKSKKEREEEKRKMNQAIARAHSDEAVSGPTAQVAFRLPVRAQAAAVENGTADATGRIVQTFKHTSTVADILTFLRSTKELAGFNWTLSEMRPTPGLVLTENLNMTIEEIGLVPKGVLVVRDLDV